MARKTEQKCDFCGKSAKQVGNLVEGGDSKKVYICSACLQTANSMMVRSGAESAFELKLQGPREIVKELDRHVCGQDEAKRSLAVSVYRLWRIRRDAAQKAHGTYHREQHAREQHEKRRALVVHAPGMFIKEFTANQFVGF
jgi:ATP-dependent protease Clp ATPase subunit